LLLDQARAGSALPEAMNHALVVDASVALKWVLFEEGTSQARALYQEALNAHHFFSEVTSALYQRTRSREPARHLPEDEAHEALTRFSRFRVETAQPANLYERAFLFARDNRLPSLYESLYIVLAQMIAGTLWTADWRLFTTASKAAPWVAWIGDYPQP
jgi:predicted nucleic acid-binding protein